MTRKTIFFLFSISIFLTANLKAEENYEFVTMWPPLAESWYFRPQGIAVDNSGNVYVVDAGNHRIQKFAPVE